MNQPARIEPRTQFSTLLDDGSLWVPDRIIPVPELVSDDAKKLLALKRESFSGMKNPTYVQVCSWFEQMHIKLSAQSAEIFAVRISRERIGGIDCVVVTPEGGIPRQNENCFLINLAGGGAFAGEKYLIEAIPLAHLARVKVLRPLYRAAEAFPAAVLDAMAVHEEMRNSFPDSRIGIYGGCTGGVATFQLVSRLIMEEMQLPDAIAGWGANGLPAMITDSMALNHDIDNLTRSKPFSKNLVQCPDHVDQKDPLFSPQLANLAEFPPAFLAAGTRDTALSGTALMHRALKRAGVDAELCVFEGMEHTFPYYPDLPEAQELYMQTTDFFRRVLELD